MARFDPDPEHDYRSDPSPYVYTSNERGVFKVHPYKEELLPLWSFKGEEAARTSSAAILEVYERYIKAQDFVGADMARKYLQMGWTRSMRYAKYKGGRKYNEDGSKREAQTWADPDKRAGAVIFKEAWDGVREDVRYQALKSAWVERSKQPGT